MTKNVVFVLDNTKKPLTPCSPARARMLLRDGKAAVWRTVPFTIIMQSTIIEPIIKPLKVKIDPGSKTTGIVLVNEKNRVIYAVELVHHGDMIKSDLESRKHNRKLRRSRKVRYRKARWLNRGRKKGWLPPSILHRVITTVTWVDRFMKWSVINGLSVEQNKFDTQKMVDSSIYGVKYQQGTLAGYNVREYLLEKWKRKCAYCGTSNVPLQVEHVHPKSKGGSNRISNLVMACAKCNDAKKSLDIADFLRNKPNTLKTIMSQLQKPLVDTAVMNSTRIKLITVLGEYGLPIELGNGAQTKYNRVKLGYVKEHWIDAACVGDSGESVIIHPQQKPLRIISMGYGNRQMTRINRFGFPCASAKRGKVVLGIKTGDLVCINQPKGKYTGIYTSRVSAIRYKDDYIAITVSGRKLWFPAKLARVKQLADGYLYM